MAQPQPLEVRPQQAGLLVQPEIEPPLLTGQLQVHVTVWAQTCMGAAPGAVLWNAWPQLLLRGAPFLLLPALSWLVSALYQGYQDDQ